MKPIHVRKWITTSLLVLLLSIGLCSCSGSIEDHISLPEDSISIEPSPGTDEETPTIDTPPYEDGSQDLPTQDDQDTSNNENCGEDAEQDETTNPSVSILKKRKITCFWNEKLYSVSEEQFDTNGLIKIWSHDYGSLEANSINYYEWILDELGNPLVCYCYDQNGVKIYEANYSYLNDLRIEYTIRYISDDMTIHELRDYDEHGNLLKSTYEHTSPTFHHTFIKEYYTDSAVEHYIETNKFLGPENQTSIQKNEVYNGITIPISYYLNGCLSYTFTVLDHTEDWTEYSGEYTFYNPDGSVNNTQSRSEVTIYWDEDTIKSRIIRQPSSISTSVIISEYDEQGYPTSIIEDTIIDGKTIDSSKQIYINEYEYW